MKWSELLDNWSLSSLSLTTGFLNMEWQPNEKDKQCAWELYVELLTSIATQPLEDNHGDELAALKNIYSLFQTTRDILKADGRHCKEFTKISIIVLNQVVRPFTAKWHKQTSSCELSSELRQEFRVDLDELQKILINYTSLLADMAGVENLIRMEES
ncbi:hypothetical protein ACTXGW_12715 [Psychrobacter faecalis]|uniref:hypothetical protein n=1 Tax=Psychrobacter faecalis TaxID=180588 RepID=UPI003FD11451